MMRIEHMIIGIGNSLERSFSLFLEFDAITSYTTYRNLIASRRAINEPDAVLMKFTLCFPK
jgi:hypothetical protein